MTREEYEAKIRFYHPQFDCDLIAETKNEYIESLESAALQPNQEVITWHDYPDEKPERHISEKVHRLRDYMGLLVSYTIGGTQFVRYDTYHWTNDELGERETFDYTEDDIYYGGAIKVKWAYMPKGVK